MNMLRLLAIVLTTSLLIGCKPLSLSSEIAVVDMNLIAKTLGRDELIIKNVQSANDNLNQQLEQIAIDLRKQLDTEKSKLGEKPSKEEEQKYMQLVQQANNQLNQKKQIALQKSQQVQSTLVAEFRNEVSKISREIAQENGYRTVLAVSDSLLWADETSDITNEVISEMRYSIYEKAGNKNEPDTATE